MSHSQRGLEAAFVERINVLTCFVTIILFSNYPITVDLQDCVILLRVCKESPYHHTKVNEVHVSKGNIDLSHGRTDLNRAKGYQHRANNNSQNITKSKNNAATQGQVQNTDQFLVASSALISSSSRLEHFIARFSPLPDLSSDDECFSVPI